MAGGLARRATLVAALRRTHPQVLLVDSGNQGTDPEKTELILQLMARLGYDAVGCGPSDITGGEAFVAAARQQALPLLNEPVAARSAPPAWRLFERGGLAVGVVVSGWVANAWDDDYRRGLLTVLREARAASRAVVLLSQLSYTAETSLARDPAFAGLADLIVGSASSSYLNGPQQLGATLFVPGVRKGRAVGTILVTERDGQLQLAHNVHPLSEDIAEDEEVARLVDGFFARRQAELPARVDVPSAPNGEGLPLPATFTVEGTAAIRARGYLTAIECGRCHPRELEQWRSTRHARSLEPLVRAERLVEECLICHSEAGRRGQSIDAAQAERYGVDCASCHGGGLRHAAAATAASIVRHPSVLLCRRCHDPEHSPRFEDPLYRPRVRHQPPAAERE